MLHYGLFTWKGNCYCSFTDVFIAVATNIHKKVSFNIECFKNFLSFSPILFTIFGVLFTRYILTSVCIFLILFSIHFLMYVYQISDSTFKLGEIKFIHIMHHASLPSQLTFIIKFHLTQNVSRTFFLPLQYYLLFLEQY